MPDNQQSRSLCDGSQRRSRIRRNVGLFVQNANRDLFPKQASDSFAQWTEVPPLHFHGECYFHPNEQLTGCQSAGQMPLTTWDLRSCTHT